MFNLPIIPVSPWSIFTVPYIFYVNVNCLHLGLVSPQVPCMSESIPILRVKGNIFKWLVIGQKAAQPHSLLTLRQISTCTHTASPLWVQSNLTILFLSSWFLTTLLHPYPQADSIRAFPSLFILFLRTNPAWDSYMLPLISSSTKLTNPQNLSSKYILNAVSSHTLCLSHSWLIHHHVSHEQLNNNL